MRRRNFGAWRQVLEKRARELARRIGFGPRWGLVAELAVRDYRHERVLSACGILALAAVLVPLLVLFGLKYGVVSNLLDPLIENPRYREIAPLSSGNFDGEWVDAMRSRTDVAFVVPKTRSLAASIKLRAPDSDVGRIVDVELIPSGPGDPVLPADTRTVDGYDRAVVAARTAEQLDVEIGERLEGVIVRMRAGREEAVRLPLIVADIAAVEAFGRDGLFVSVELLAAVEDYLDGRAVPALGWDGAEPRGDSRSFAGFRLYASSLADVAQVERALRAQGIDVRTNAADVALVARLDRNLSAVYWMIAVIAVTGFCVSFGTSVWANVDRKQREFSILRLTGFRTEDIVWFPVVQAVLMATAAWLLSCLAFAVIQAVLNGMLASSLGGGSPVCRLRAWHLIAALLLTIAAASAAAASGGLRAARREPSIGLRAG
jgi:putative ABC transport system permease protein